MPLLTVFTPAYNRDYSLPRTYESLRAQDCLDFVWLVVDDGSTDGTAQLVSRWQREETSFEIRYIHKENGGMHTAHNAAYEVIDTELNVCIDSDDALAPGAVRKIKEKWEAVRERGYAGIIALDADMASGEVIGKGFPEGMNETTLGGYYAAGGKGDKKLVYRTDVVRQYPPYPVFEGEVFVPLGCLYSDIDRDYKLAVLNEVLCLVEYMEDGSTRNMLRQYKRSPRGFAYSRLQAMRAQTSKKALFRTCIHYVSSSLLCHNRRFLAESPRKGMTLLAFPFGLALTLLIKIKVRD